MSADPMVDRPRGGGILARTHKRTAERNDSNAWRGPVAGILLGGVAVLAFLALASYSPRHGVDWAGPIGRLLAEGLLEAAGIGAYGIVLLLAAVSSALVAGRPRLSLAARRVVDRLQRLCDGARRSRRPVADPGPCSGRSARIRARLVRRGWPFHLGSGGPACRLGMRCPRRRDGSVGVARRFRGRKAGHRWKRA